MIRNLVALVRDLLNRPRAGVEAVRAQMRHELMSALVEERADVRLYYGCDEADFEEWETGATREPDHA